MHLYDRAGANGPGYSPSEHIETLDKMLSLLNGFTNLRCLKIALRAVCLHSEERPPDHAVFGRVLDFLPSPDQLLQLSMPRLRSLEVDFTPPVALLTTITAPITCSTSQTWQVLKRLMASCNCDRLVLEYGDFSLLPPPGHLDLQEELAEVKCLTNLVIRDPNERLDDGRIGDFVRRCSQLSHLMLDFRQSDVYTLRHVSEIMLGNQPVQQLRHLAIVYVEIDDQATPLAALCPHLSSLRIEFYGPNPIDELGRIFSATPWPSLRAVSLITLDAYPTLSTSVNPLQVIFQCFADRTTYPKLQDCHLSSDLGTIRTFASTHPLFRLPDHHYLLEDAWNQVISDYEASPAAKPSSINFRYNCWKHRRSGNRLKAVYRKDGEVHVDWWPDC